MTNWPAVACPKALTKAIAAAAVGVVTAVKVEEKKVKTSRSSSVSEGLSLEVTFKKCFILFVA